jgi:putative membrane protein
LFWVLVAVAVAALVRAFIRGRMDLPYPGYAGGSAPYGPTGPGPRQQASPEQILAERSARGEINQDEFHERMAALRAETPHPHPGPAPESS